MTPELDKKLCKRFPVLYQDRHSPMSQTCMCWGFDCGDGWFEIIWQLSLAIEEELDYSWLQERWFLFIKAFARGWNALMYFLSPVRQKTYRREGKGTKEEPYDYNVLDHQDPPRWDERIVQFLFGKMAKHGRFESERTALKRLTFWPNTGFAVRQVKEKYGTLRFYCNSTPMIDRFIQLAEELSAITCEECGKSGRLGRIGGYYCTRCDSHGGDHFHPITEENEHG
jgi:hypothetical protein